MQIDEEYHQSKPGTKCTRYYNKPIKVLDRPTSSTQLYIEYDDNQHLGKPFREIKYGAFMQHNLRARKKKGSQKMNMRTTDRLEADASVSDDCSESSYSDITLKLADKQPRSRLEDKQRTPPHTEGPVKSQKKRMAVTIDEAQKRDCAEALSDLANSQKTIMLKN